MYENSDDNIFRSVLVYYSMGVMGKRKYMKVRYFFLIKKVLFKGKKMVSLKVVNCCVFVFLLYYKFV